MTALDDGPYSQALASFGKSCRPRAVVVISGHWEDSGPVRVSSSEAPPMIYDFSGFPPQLYAVHYPAPGDPALAGRIVRTLNSAGIAAVPDPGRGFDHGTWVPMRLIYPQADIPVVQVSLPRPRTPESLFALGEALAPLREDNIMILGSGGITHNLFMQRPAGNGPPQAWAVGFDEWVERALATRDHETLFRYAQLAPYARHAVPTTDHFDPLFVTLGSAGKYSVETIYEGFQMSHFSLRSFALVS